MNSQNFKILHIEDDEMLREIFFDIFRDNISENIIQSHNKKMAILELEKINHYDIVICDYELPDGNGLDIYSYLRSVSPQTPFCLFSSRNDIKLDHYKKDKHFTFFLKLDNYEPLIAWANAYKTSQT